VNLVTNAIKYSEPGTQITLSARGDQSAVRFEVADQGVGIRKEHVPRLFEKFYRADDPAVRRTAGTGLGLYIVRSLVAMLGGQVHVRSRHGKGSIFVVTLPRADAVTQQVRPRRRNGERNRERTRIAVGAS
jgi:signal transduction histidine kinase